MKKTLHTTLFVAGAVFSLHAQTPSIPFTDQSSLLPTTTFHSGCAIGVVDMNGDRKDDIVRASQNQTMYIEYQQAPNATFQEVSSPAAIGSNNNWPWGMCVGDFNNDGYNDVLWGNNGVTRILHWNGAGYTSTNVTSLVGATSIFVQGCNFFDINNDGYLDAFVCHDSGMPHIYVGNGNPSGWTFNQALMPLATVPSSDNSGNYASIWCDINNDNLPDLMITHCRQGVTNSSDARRIDQIFINNGNGTYTQDVTNWTGLRDGGQGWSTAWGDIDNDGDMDAFVLNQDVNGKLQINNGSGVFTNMMVGSGIYNTTTYFGENATFEDFDNDGFVDLLLSGDSSILYRNNGNLTFTKVAPNPFSYGSNNFRAHAFGDLNGDGFIDIYSSYCILYISPSSKNDKLWMNACPQNGNTNHYIFFDLTGTTSNKNGVGAKVKIYGPWGVQEREVRSGEAYGCQNSMRLHFGLGQQTSVDSVIIYWPSGIVDEMLSLPGDQSYSVVEGGFPTTTNAFDSHTFELNVFPNPASDQAFIRLDHFAQFGLNNLSLNIIDMNGKVVYTQTSLTQSIITVDHSMLSKGMYFVEISDKDKRLATQKLILQ